MPSPRDKPEDSIPATFTAFAAASTVNPVLDRAVELLRLWVAASAAMSGAGSTHVEHCKLCLGAYRQEQESCPCKATRVFLVEVAPAPEGGSGKPGKEANAEGAGRVPMGDVDTATPPKSAI